MNSREMNGGGSGGSAHGCCVKQSAMLNLIMR